MRRPLNILQISTREIGGGAEKVAHDLYQGLRRDGHALRLAVGYRKTTDPNVVTIPNSHCGRAWSDFWWRRHERLQPRYGKFRGSKPLARLYHLLAEPRSWLDRRRGIEDFRYPGTRKLIDVLPWKPDVIHCHNLHGGYFDLEALPELSRVAPLVVTLHDTWMLAGHCAYSLGCDRWKTGCGKCPDLTIYPALQSDATDYNWRRKREIFSQSRIHVVTPSRWLMDQVDQSMLGPHALSRHVIPNGVDLSVFRPGIRTQVRSRLGLDANAVVLVFAANGIRRNRFKDYSTIREAVARVAQRQPDLPVQFVGLGESAPDERAGRAHVRFVPFQSDPNGLADYYRAADLYVHAARAETFGNTLVEAMACGTAVVATAVGGIPEILGPTAITNAGELGRADAAGWLVAGESPESMAEAISVLVERQECRAQMAKSAARRAANCFGLERHIEQHIALYRELIESDIPVDQMDHCPTDLVSRGHRASGRLQRQC